MLESFATRAWMSSRLGILAMPPERSVERLAAVEAKVPMFFNSSALSSAAFLPLSRMQASAVPPKISPAPVVSIGETCGPAQ